MRVLVISEHYFPIRGGSTTYVYNLCKSLSEIGCEIFLVTIPDDKNPTSEWCAEGNFHVYRLKIPKLLRKERYFPVFLRKRLKSIIKDINPDVIHFAYGFFTPLTTRTYLHKINILVIWTIQNVPPLEHKIDLFTRVKPLHKLLENIYFLLGEIYGRFALKVSNYDRLICVSEKTARLAMERGVPSNNIKVIHDGVDTDIFVQKKDTSIIKEKIGVQVHGPIILTVAGIIPHKGLNFLLEAVPNVLEKYPHALFLIVGPIRSEDYFQKLSRLATDLDIVNNVKIIPGVPPSEINEYYAIADLYVQPSLEEGFCMSILEAMACGKPVVGTKTGAIPKFINESDGGILIEPASSKQIYEAVVKLLADPEEMENMGLISRDYVVKNYSWNKIARDTLELYKSLLQ